MSFYCSLFDERLWICCHASAGPPPADAVLPVASLDQAAIVTTLKGDRGWLYHSPLELLRAVHVEQWLRKRGPVYFQPPGDSAFYKADIANSPETAPFR